MTGHPTVIRRLLTGGGALTVGLALLVVSGGATAGAATKSKAPLTLYSGQHVQTTQALVNAFEKKTGIKVNIRFDDEDVLADQLVTEGTHSHADVFFTENTPPLQFLSSKHLLDSVTPATLARTPSKDNSPTGQWVGVSARVSVLVYNTKLIKKSQLPKTAMALSDPKWKGKIGLAPGETDFQPIVTSIEKAHGSAATLSWLNGIKANAGSHIYPDNETLADEVNRGQVALGVVNQYYWYRERAEIGASNMHSAIAYFAPHDVGYVLDVSGAGILRSSTHVSEAQQLVAFFNSVQGQQIISHSQSFEYPIASGVSTAQPETPLSQLKPNGITIPELGTGAAAVALLQQAQLL